MPCLFCSIAHGETKANLIYENDHIVAFSDINPQAPTHILIIPKKHIATINDVEEDDEVLLGRMVSLAKKIAKDNNLSKDGYRLVFNVNEGGGQAVYHIHLHLLGGRQMTWPPG